MTDTHYNHRPLFGDPTSRTEVQRWLEEHFWRVEDQRRDDLEEESRKAAVNHVGKIFATGLGLALAVAIFFLISKFF